MHACMHACLPSLACVLTFTCCIRNHSHTRSPTHHPPPTSTYTLTSGRPQSRRSPFRAASRVWDTDACSAAIAPQARELRHWNGAGSRLLDGQAFNLSPRAGRSSPALPPASNAHYTYKLYWAMMRLQSGHVTRLLMAPTPAVLAFDFRSSSAGGRPTGGLAEDRHERGQLQQHEQSALGELQPCEGAQATAGATHTRHNSSAPAMFCHPASSSGGGGWLNMLKHKWHRRC